MTGVELHLFLRTLPQFNWRGIITALHDADLDSPRRSTVPLVAYWQDLPTRLARLNEGLGFPVTSPVTFSFEYPVDVGRGRGQPSCTDLMITAPSVAIAIEAKYTESPYETVAEWLHQPPDENRTEVLRGWLDMVRIGIAVPLTLDAIHQLPYQLVHRAASACVPAAIYRAVVYQLFDLTLRDSYIEDLRALRALIPASKLTLASWQHLPRHLQAMRVCWRAGTTENGRWGVRSGQCLSALRRSPSRSRR